MTSRSVIARPWLKAGLSALLLESEERVLALRQKPGEASPASAAPAVEKKPFAPPPRNGASFVAPPFRETTKAALAEKRVTPQQRPVSADRGPAVESAAPARPVKTASSSDLLVTPGALPVESWPETWLALKNRRPLPPSPLVLWTYFGLGEALTGVPDETRKKVIVRMLMELRHPGGTHVFWPCNLPGEENGAALFWSGVKLLNPRVLLLFGSDARDVLAMPKTLFPFCEERVHGRLVVQMPRPQALADDEPSFRRVLVFLSRRLGFCEKRRG